MDTTTTNSSLGLDPELLKKQKSNAAAADNPQFQKFLERQRAKDDEVAGRSQQLLSNFRPRARSIDIL